MFGDFPPPACWASTTAQVRLVGPYFNGQTYVHVAGGATSGTQRVGIGYFAVPDWYCDIPGVASYLCTTPVTGAPNDSIWYTSWSGSHTASANHVRLLDDPSAAEVLEPIVTFDVDEASRAIQVARVHPGAEVVATIGSTDYYGFSHDRTHVTIPVPPGITSSTSITVEQFVGSESAFTSVTSISGSAGPHAIRAPFGYEVGDVAVAVTGFAPGSLITIRNASTNAVIGSSELGGTMGVVPICAAPASIKLEATRNGTTVSRIVDGYSWRDDSGGISVTSSSYGNPVGCYNYPLDPSCMHMYGPAGLAGGGDLGKAPRYRVYAPTADTRGVVFLMHGQNSEPGCDYSGGYWRRDEPEDTAPHIANEIISDGLGQDDSYASYDYLAARLASGRPQGIRSVAAGVTRAGPPGRR